MTDTTTPRPILLLVADYAECQWVPTTEAEARWCREIVRLAEEMGRFQEVTRRHAEKYPKVETP